MKNKHRLGFNKIVDILNKKIIGMELEANECDCGCISIEKSTAIDIEWPKIDRQIPLYYLWQVRMVGNETCQKSSACLGSFMETDELIKLFREHFGDAAF